MALAVTAVWIRSYSMFDGVLYPLAERQQSIGTTEGIIYWWGYAIQPEWGFESMRMPSTISRIAVENAKRILSEVDDTNFREWTFPFWSIVLPLTLLLVPARKRPPTVSRSDA
ncbi:MAG: hypothetical protein JWP89_6925 [Schlesneria sp.]|nr:hypothetical protein [Schlesneria sp.]